MTDPTKRGLIAGILAAPLAVRLMAGASVSALLPETAAFVRARGVTDARYIGNVDRLIRALQESGTWASRDGVYMFRAPDAETAFLNVKV